MGDDKDMRASCVEVRETLNIAREVIYSYEERGDPRCLQENKAVRWEGNHPQMGSSKTYGQQTWEDHSSTHNPQPPT
jgi:hypothetical protein